MSIVVKLPSASEQRERRLHLREISQEETATTKLAGAMLREKRIELGIDEKSIASKLKMRMDQLRAIELSDYAKLPGRTYAVGFIRAYAKTLGLDAEALVDQFKSETQSHELGKPAELVFPEVAPAPKWPSGGIVVVAIVVAIVIYGIAQLTMPGAETAKTASVDDSSVTVVDANPASGAAKTADNTSGVTVSPEMPATQPILPVIGNDAATMERLVKGLTASLTPVAPGAPVAVVPATESPPAIPAGTQATVPPVHTEASRITLKAVEATYVQIKDLSLRKPKSVLLARVMNPGESFQAPDRSNLVLLTGNAGGVQVEVDGRNAGVLGKSGQVIKRLALDPAYFLSRADTSR
jgi:cytoskeleton protein RodZ